MAPPKKRTKLSTDQPTEILFDVSARQDYLTGFHKRKVARVEHAKELAVKREREDRIKERRQIREQRKEDLQQHIRDVNKEFKKMNPDLSSDEEETGEGEEPEQALPSASILEDQQEEYVDEDKYTTVTVEPMGEESEVEDTERKAEPQPTAKQKADAPTKKKKRKKFRYESKAERQETRRKQKAKNSRDAKARREK